MSFQELNLDNLLQKVVCKLGFTEPTEIQSSSIPVIGEGKDVVALAQTGTGKTAAYLLPILDRLIKDPVAKRKQLMKSPRVLVLVPTRELAQQVQQSCIELAGYIEMFKSIVITGGVPYHRHKRKLNSNIDVMIGTPGRVLDYIHNRKINFDKLDFLVLDEADRMLDMGFSKDVLKIVDSAADSAQKLLFSATINPKVKSLYKQFMPEPVMIKTKNSNESKKNITQKIQYVNNLVEKSKALEKIIATSDIEQSIIFTNTKSSAEQLANQLVKKGYEADALHGDMRQAVRNKIINKFKSKDIRFLVGTDILGRGIDVPSVSHVINYDVPKEPEDYVHRIGRTGRASATGEAITLSYMKEFLQQKKIEDYIGHPIDALQLEGFSSYQGSKGKPAGKRSPRRRFRRR